MALAGKMGGWGVVGGLVLVQMPVCVCVTQFRNELTGCIRSWD